MYTVDQSYVPELFFQSFVLLQMSVFFNETLLPLKNNPVVPVLLRLCITWTPEANRVCEISFSTRGNKGVWVLLLLPAWLRKGRVRNTGLVTCSSPLEIYKKNSEALYRDFISEIILIRQVWEKIHLCCSASYWISLCFMWKGSELLASKSLVAIW